MSKETLQEEIDELKKIKQSLQMDIIELDDKILFQDFGVYQPQYNFATLDEYKEKLDAIRTKAEEVYDLIYSIETPIIVAVPQRADQPNKDSYNGTECSGASLAEIVAKLSAADLDVRYSLNPTGTNTTVEAQLRAFETESGQIVDVLGIFEKHIDRYNVSLAAAKANAATGVIALIDALPQYGANNATATLTLDAGQEEKTNSKYVI